MVTQEWDIVLLLIATVAGYILGRTSGHRVGKKDFSPDPSRLQSLIQWFDLHNESDIQNLLQKLEVTSETLETHLAIALMFRKKGEFTKSIAIHQNIFGRPNVETEVNHRVQFELACDFLSMGMMTRAEGLFSELIDNQSSLKYKSIEKLVHIYDSERDWANCVRIGEMFGRKIKHEQALALSHHYCELSLIAKNNQYVHDSERFLKKALAHNSQNARVWLLYASNESSKGNNKTAFNMTIKAANKCPAFMSEILPKAYEYAKASGNEHKYNVFLGKLLVKYPLSSVQLAQVEYNYIQRPDAPLDLSDLYKVDIPSRKVVSRIISSYRQDANTPNTIPVIFDWLTVLLSRDPRFQCKSCGYESSAHIWQCPQCKQWDSVLDREDRLQLMNNNQVHL